MTGILQDFRYALRQLRKNPGFFAVAALTLALAIGANTAIFSVVNAFLLRKPHVPDPDRLLVIGSINLADRRSVRSGVSAPDFVDWRSQATSFDGISAATYDDFTISSDQNPERIPGARVSADFFRVMDVSPALGRSLASEESDPVAVISDDLWQSRFGAARDVLGRQLKINGVAHTIVGVMPKSFRSWEFRADVWVPLKFSADDLASKARSCILWPRHRWVLCIRDVALFSHGGYRLEWVGDLFVRGFSNRQRDLSFGGRNADECRAGCMLAARATRSKGRSYGGAAI